MKNNTIKTGVILLSIFLAGFSLSAQEKKNEKSKMTVKVLKEGKTVLDTTYIMNEDFDQEKVEAMIEGLDGDSKTIDIFKTQSEDGEVFKYFVKKGAEGEKNKNSNVVIIKEIGEGCEEVEIETEVIVVEGHENLHNFHTKEGNVFIHEGHGENFTWTTDDKEGNVTVDFLGDSNENDFMFISNERKSQISLDQKGNGTYRLEFESDELEPIKIEVFDGEGNKLFRKKVKNFYGRFLKDVELSDNESGLFTVRVLQGENEIIGEFEYK